MKILMFATLTAALLFSLTTAQARKSDTRSIDRFATGSCKRSSCFARHPSGHYRFPYHYGHRRYH